MYACFDVSSAVSLLHPYTTNGESLHRLAVRENAKKQCVCLGASWCHSVMRRYRLFA